MYTLLKILTCLAYPGECYMLMIWACNSRNQGYIKSKLLIWRVALYAFKSDVKSYNLQQMLCGMLVIHIEYMAKVLAVHCCLIAAGD